MLFRLKKRRLCCLLLCAFMLINVFSLQLKSASAEENPRSNAFNYGLSDKAGEGNILHCSNMYFSRIKDMLPDIARQGFSAVQVSPVQGNKVSINSGAYFCDWTFFYQPINFEVGNELGSKEDFKQLCTEADKYGIKVIVDIIANHTAQGSDGRSGSISEQTQAPYNDPQYYHGNKRDASNNTRTTQVLYNVGGLPDLDTSNPEVQKWVYNLLEECVSLGADGFRFDTAKHIETADDGELASDFWQNTACKIKEKYDYLYMYGEVVDLQEKADITSYTSFMSVTDAGYGIYARSSINKGTVTNLPTTAGVYNDSAIPEGRAVLWAESHDEFFSGTTTKMKESVLIKTYAALAAREGVPTLFFIRPAVDNVVNDNNWDMLVGEYKDTWLSKEIREVNLLKNTYQGETERLSAYQNKYYTVHRGDDGLCIVNAGGDAIINVPTTLADGTYKDRISGNNFTVSGGFIKGKIAESGVAVFYKENAVPDVKVTLNKSEVKENYCASIADDENVVEISLKNAESGSYKLAGNDICEFSGGVELTFAGSKIPSGCVVPLTVTSTTSAGRTTVHNYTFVKKAQSDSITVYFDAPATAFYSVEEDNPESAGVPYVLAKDADDNLLTPYPGYEMEKVNDSSYEHLYKCSLSAETSYIKFNDGTPDSAKADAHTIPSTECVYGDAALTENRIKGGFEVTGSVLWSKGKLTDVNSDGSLYEEYAQKLEVSSEEKEPVSDSEYITIKQEIVTESMYGDVNSDSDITMLDVTSIQKNIVKLIQFDEQAVKAADVDSKDGVTLLDVVLIQRYIAKLIPDFPAGKTFKTVTYIEITTEADYINTETDDITDTESTDESDTQTDTQTDTDDSSTDTAEERVLYFKNTLGWEKVYAHYWEDLGAVGNKWPGEEMEPLGDDLYKITISDDINANRIIFNDGGNGTQSANLHFDVFGMTFEPTESIGKDKYGNTLYKGTWDGTEAEYDEP